MKKRIAAETPEINRYGVHVLASQNDTGVMLPRDSHEYDNDISSFDNAKIDDIILPEDADFVAEPQQGVNIVIAPGGGGMTLPFGLAEEFWNSWAETPSGVLDGPTEQA